MRFPFLDASWALVVRSRGDSQQDIDSPKAPACLPAEPGPANSASAVPDFHLAPIATSAGGGLRQHAMGATV